MKTQALVLALLASAPLSHAGIVVPGANNTDGTLNITSNTVIDLSQATTGAWDSDNSAHAGLGVYDASKWAVVFKYSNVNIAAGATVTFKNHPTHAPVVWLVDGNVTIAGTISLDGQAGQAFPTPAEPGPGGFRGGIEFQPGIGQGSGFGPGGGQRGDWSVGGSYGSAGGGNATTSTYGNPSLIPLLGGSGGGAHNNRSDNQRWGGGAGGGAMLIASNGTVTVDGEIHANGGGGRTAGGAGGGIRIVSSTLAGSGRLNALGGRIDWNAGGQGRIRLERELNTNSITTVPSPSVVSLANGATALLWMPETGPQVEVVSIGGVAAPADPLASFGTTGADVAVAETSPTPVVVRTTNVEAAARVIVRVTPRTGAGFTETVATLTTTESTNPLVITWTANVPVVTGYSAVQVRVVRP